MTKKMQVLTLVGGMIVVASALAQSEHSIAVRDAGSPGLKVLGVTAKEVGDAVIVEGRVSRDHRTQVLAPKVLAVEIHAADGALKAREQLVISPSQLPRRNARDLHFNLRLPQPGAGDTLVLVLGRG